MPFEGHQQAEMGAKNPKSAENTRAKIWSNQQRKKNRPIAYDSGKLHKPSEHLVGNKIIANLKNSPCLEHGSEPSKRKNVGTTQKSLGSQGRIDFQSNTQPCPCGFSFVGQELCLCVSLCCFLGDSVKDGSRLAGLQVGLCSVL